MIKIAHLITAALLLYPIAANAADKRTELYAYPKGGQSPQQQRADKEYCQHWASEQTGYEPRSKTDQPPPDDEVSFPKDTGSKHVLLSYAYQLEAEKKEKARSKHVAAIQRAQRLEKYNRALTACLEGKNYSVK